MDLDLAEQQYLVSGGRTGLLELHDLRLTLNNKGTRPQPLTSPTDWKSPHNREVLSVTWWPFDTGLLVSGAADAQVKVWDPNTLQPALEVRMPGAALCCRFSPVATHRLLAVGVDDPSSPGVRLVDVASGTAVQTLSGHKQPCRAVCWSPVREYTVATGSDDKTVRMWDIRRPGALLVLDQHNAASAATHTKYISGSDRVSSQHRHSHDGRVTHLLFGPGGLLLYSAGDDGRLRQWDAHTGRNTMVNFAAGSTARLCQFSPTQEGGHVLYPRLNKLCILNAKTGRLVRAVPGHFRRINCVQAHASQQMAVTGGEDGAMLVWEPRAPDEEAMDEDAWSESEDDASGFI